MIEAGVRATVFLDIAGEAPTAEAMDGFAAGAIDRFFRDNWPFGDPRPAVFYDPRTVEPRSRASLHAKCVVVDERKAFVTSANFTGRGQSRNIEVGVLIEDPCFATKLVGQWNGLVEAGLVKAVAE